MDEFSIRLLHPLLALLLAPLLPGLINRVKAFFGARRGPSLWQLYYDLAKLARKGAVFSRSTSWVFRAGPAVGLAAVAAALAVTPLLGAPAAFSFAGDFVFMAYCLGLMRFFLVVSALDTASAFCGMGASREVQFSALAEVALFGVCAALAVLTHSLSLGGFFGDLWSAPLWVEGADALLFAAAALMLVLLCEAARIPFDDPTTHLELTMIHEAMILDHGGVDLAMLEYAAAVKFWVLGALLVSLLVPWRSGSPLVDLAAGVGALFLLALLVGLIESIMARLRLVRVPSLLVVATAFALFAVALAWR